MRVYVGGGSSAKPEEYKRNSKQKNIIYNKTGLSVPWAAARPPGPPVPQLVPESAERRIQRGLHIVDSLSCYTLLNMSLWLKKWNIWLHTTSADFNIHPQETNYFIENV